ncbi:MAG: hypothetical protein ABW252_20420 [Polyangiales bacterium]
MQRWQGAALAAALCSGCLDPLVDDQPGYSRLVLAPGTAVASAYDDPLIARKIDTNDGVGMGAIALKSGFAAGDAVRYWDLGAARRPSPAYLLYDCSIAPHRPLAQHAPIVESIPGDVDYSPFRSLYKRCVTPKYAGHLLTSIEALEDAFDLGLVGEPEAAGLWRNMPIVAPNVDLSFDTATRRASEAYYEGKTVLFHQFTDQEGEFSNPSMMPPPGYALEIVRPDAPAAVVRTIFSQAYRAADGTQNPAYTPQWTVVTLTLRALDPALATDAQQEEIDLQSWTRDTDLVSYGPSGSPMKKPGTRVATLQTANTRVNRPFLVKGVP